MSASIFKAIRDQRQGPPGERASAITRDRVFAVQIRGSSLARTNHSARYRRCRFERASRALLGAQ